MTDDLEGRLDPSTLENSKVLHDEESEDFYESNNSFSLMSPGVDLPPPPTVSVFVIFATLETVELKGNLQSLSFGHEGWLCSMSTESKELPVIALRAAKEPVVSARIVLADGSFEMRINVDCTASFSYGSASFTVTSDEACYV